MKTRRLISTLARIRHGARSALTLTLFLTFQQVHAFCGFYVAKAGATLFNKSSQVIIVRDGDRSVITMSSDYQGEAKDFAMVVPVPEVLKQRDIRVVQQFIFDKFDAFTAPRLVEYWDRNPCPRDEITALYSMKNMSVEISGKQRRKAKKNGVKIEAKYTVGEYDILILSAKQSDGLKTWLIDNGYKIPDGAEEVLDPYIKDGMKFFVVKVNMEEQQKLGLSTLRPLQIQFQSSKFMLPIRLGMANATEAQDMIVYAFTRKGRVETANYRTAKLPTDRDLPEFLKTEQGLFGEFYKACFEKAWAKEGKNAVMLEYAWDESSVQNVKCDPCPSPLINYAETREAGIWWLTPNELSDAYVGDLFITRLHVRYARNTFPQDLMFTNTPDQSSFQARYVIRHKATGDLDCEEAEFYLKELRLRRKGELQELAELTDWDVRKWSSYLGDLGKPHDRMPSFPSPLEEAEFERSLGYGGEGQTDGLTDPQSAIAESDAFLKAGVGAPGSGISRNQWLLALAGLMFAGGMAVRLAGRRKKGKGNPQRPI